MNKEAKEKQISKFLSLVLRHKPQQIGLSLDNNGWADVDELLQKAAKAGRRISMDELESVVENNDKQRFLLDKENNRIRANQGHSINVDLEFEAQQPPAVLFHGTVEKFVEDIKKDGLKKMNRQHVHLSKDTQTATIVGKRRGKPFILEIKAKEMSDAGHEFYLSENGVWLTDRVPVEFIVFPS